MRFTLFLTLIALACALAGCGPSGGSAKYNVYMSQSNNAEPWRAMMNDDLKRAAEKYPDIGLTIKDAQKASMRQQMDIKDILALGTCDLLIVSPNEASPLTEVVTEAAKKIPVIVLDRDIDWKDEQPYALFIGCDNWEIGRKAGKFLIESLTPLMKSGTTANVVEVMGMQSTPPGQERHGGFQEVLDEWRTANPELSKHLEIILRQDGLWERSNGNTIMRDALALGKPIHAVYGHNDPMALGAYDAYVEARSAEEAKKVVFIGVDGLKPTPENPGGLKEVKDGRLTATITYNTCGKAAIEEAAKILEAGDAWKSAKPRRLNPPSVLVTRENVDEVLSQ
jgi:ribose transport system substrate-binding protein